MFVNSSDPVIRIESVSVATSPLPLPFPVWCGCAVGGGRWQPRPLGARVFAGTARRRARCGRQQHAERLTARSLYQPATQHEETTGPRRRPDSPWETGAGAGEEASSWWMPREETERLEAKNQYRPASGRRTATRIYRARQSPALESHQWCKLQCRHVRQPARQIDRQATEFCARRNYFRQAIAISHWFGFPEANSWSI